MKSSFGSTKVLRDINFSLEEGQVLAIIGSSGSGKTTLLRCLNFLETPDQGTHLRPGRGPLRRRRPRHPAGGGDPPQAPPLRPGVPELQPLPPVHRPAERHPGPGTHGQGARKPAEDLAAIRAEGEHLLTQMGLQDRMGNYPHQLSGGQQQRVAIARALAMKPDILCFDEPTSALDPELTGEVLRVIRGLAEQHTTMIIVTHEMSFARDVADQVIFMDGGVVVEEGTPEAVFGNPQQERTRQFLEKYRGD